MASNPFPDDANTSSQMIAAFDLRAELAKMSADLKLMFSSNRDEVQGQIRGQDQRIDLIHNDVQTLQKAVANLTETLKLPQGYRTTEWFNFDNLHAGSPYTARASDGSLTMAKKIKVSDIPSFGAVLIDDWIDDFEDWCETQFGSPYASGMDEQVIRLFLGAIEARKDIKTAYRSYRKTSPPPHTWIRIVIALHNDMMTDDECSQRGSEKSLEACVQGNLSIKEYNLLFNSTLHRMKRYGNPHILPSRAKEVVRIYIGNLVPYYNSTQCGLPTAGLFFETPELAQCNFYEIQLYMECMGHRVAPSNASTFGPIDPSTPPTPHYEAPFSSSGPMITPAADVALDPGMWDLINGLEKMNIDEADRASILRMV
ncbi:hypothetical protein CPB97_004571 [Podila verticillata]|nr:hypothetical protein CPB97_004571 [Podila verticillata]